MQRIPCPCPNVFFCKIHVTNRGAGVTLLDLKQKDLLLGKEVYSLRHKTKEYWSDFGGKVDPLDNGVWHTACREMKEELYGCLSSLSDVFTETPTLVKMCVTNIKCKPQNGYHRLRRYVCFVICGVYDEAFRSSLVYAFNRAYLHVRPEEVEKCRISWFKLWRLTIPISFRNRDVPELLLRSVLR